MHSTPKSKTSTLPFVFINMAIPSTIRDIASRVRAGAVEAGRDPNKLEIITKVRVSLHPDRAVARSRLRQVLTFYNIADHYRDMLIASGFEPEVKEIQEAFKAGGFKAAATKMTDAYMDKLPVIPATSVKEIKERLKPFAEAGATRLVVPYVPVSEPVVKRIEIVGGVPRDVNMQRRETHRVLA